MNNFIILFCALSFLGYGVSCLFAAHMVAEFERYRLARFRFLTGLLQVLAAVGLLIGLKIPVVAGIAAGGLALQMACGLGVRIRIKDPWYLCLPAATYMLLCSYLAVTLI
jgi:hypothetical protein